MKKRVAESNDLPLGYEPSELPVLQPALLLIGASPAPAGGFHAHHRHRLRTIP